MDESKRTIIVIMIEGMDDEKCKKKFEGTFLEEGHHLRVGVVSGDEHISAVAAGRTSRWCC